MNEDQKIQRRQMLARMGKGQVQALKPMQCSPYMPTTGKDPWDKEQARLNREAGIA